MDPGKLLGHIFTALFILLALSAVLVIVTPVTGWRMGTVMSGSMEPAIHTGDLVIIRPAIVGDIRAGDVIAYSGGGVEICHRVVEVDAGPPLRFIMKGDANRAPDPDPVTTGNVEGMVAFSIPQAGYFAHFVKTPAGLILTFLLAALLLIGSEFIPKIFDRREEDRSRGGKYRSLDGKYHSRDRK